MGKIVSVYVCVQCMVVTGSPSTTVCVYVYVYVCFCECFKEVSAEL